LREDRESGARASDRQASLLREAQAMARLSHPNVVSVYDVGTFETQVFVAMEFVEGETLKQWLKRERRPLTEIVDGLVSAGKGLAAAHSVGILHRDFKPDNVLVGKDGRVRVTDFGLARPIEGPWEPLASSSDKAFEALRFAGARTETGAIKGTPAYMAPEQ